MALDGGIWELVRDPAGRDEDRRTKLPRLMAGKFATTPNEDEAAYVLIKHLDDEKHRIGPCPWSPRLLDAGHYGVPERGDRCLVAFTEEDEPWIIEWWPYD